MNHKDLISFVESKNLFSRQDNILLAVSGGIDSAVMVSLFREARYQFGIIHCNFRLRGTSSEGDAEFVKTMADRIAVPYFFKEFSTKKVAAGSGRSIQMVARELRYDWFETILKEHNFKYVATAHHLDDQVETFLINLFRGTGIAGLHGIPVINCSIIRPLLYTCRKEIEQYAMQNDVAFRTDQSNLDTKYLRNKIRLEVIPILTAINPDFQQGLTETIRRIADFEQIGNGVLRKWCSKAINWESDHGTIEISNLVQLSPVEPYLWMLLSPFGFNETQLSNILGCLYKQTRKVFNSDTHSLIKDRDHLVISKKKSQIQYETIEIAMFAGKKNIRKPVRLNFQRILCTNTFKIPADETKASLDLSKLHFPLVLRKWQNGDVFFPLGMRRRKKLSDFFIDQKFSIEEKERTWLLCSGNDIAWIIGHRIDHRFRVTPETTEVLFIESCSL
jgi:tRNA(Ile)-lysidine synthase